MSELPPDHVPAPFVTFYSFKGGVGRSMTLINVAGILAGRGFRILVVDLDLEAPGLSFLGPGESDSEGTSTQLGFIDLLSDAIQRGSDSDLLASAPAQVVERYSRRYAVPQEILQRTDGTLRIMPAGRLDTAYQLSLDKLDLPGLYRDGLGQPLIEAFKRVIQNSNQFDYVLVDSRTGFSDESGICTRDLADHLVVVTGLNNQNVIGTAKFLNVLRQATDGKRSIQFVLSPVPQGEEELVDKREAKAQEVFAAAWGKPVDLSLQIPYHPRLALTEEPHIFRRSRGHLYNAYVAVENALLQALGLTSETLVREASKAVRRGGYALALNQLRVAVKLDGGRYALEGLNLISLSQAGRDAKMDQNYAWFMDAKAQPLLTFLAQELPAGSSYLYDWANRLHDARCDAAEMFYRQILADAPTDSITLGNYTEFLNYVRQDQAHAKILYMRALAADPNNLGHLGNYANLLTDINPTNDQAEVLFTRVLATLPGNANDLANYARLLFINARDMEARDLLERALAINPQRDAVRCELLFYAYAHDWRRWPESLALLKSHLVAGERSYGWRLAANVERARVQGHPEPELVAVLADVIADKVPLTSLDAFPSWTAL